MAATGSVWVTTKRGLLSEPNPVAEPAKNTVVVKLLPQVGGESSASEVIRNPSLVIPARVILLIPVAFNVKLL